VGVVRAEIARQFGLGPDVLVSGSGDNMMGAIGTGNVAAGIVTASLGTSGTIYACSEQPIVDPAGEVAAFCDASGRWLPLVCTMNVTVATEMVRKMFGMDHAALSEAAASVPPGSHGLMLIPFFEGERTPNVPDGTGVWLGVRDRTSDRAHMARAAMEGVTLGLNYGLHRLRSLGLAPRDIRLTGGGSRSAVWRQIAADVFNCPVVCPASEEGAAFGAALHAMWVWHHARGEDVPITDIAQRFVTLDETTRAVPDQRSVGVYRELQELFDETARDLSGVFARHRRLVAG
jgi:xylulokinase